MKCPNCGSEMPLEYRFCPYCGAKNQAAEQHAADMAKYESEFARTKAEVENRSRRYGTNLIKAVAAAVLVFLIIITMVINNNAWSFRRDLIRRQAEKHYDTVSESLCQSLAAGNYAEFSAFMDHYGLNYIYNSPFTGFSRVLRAANLYLEIENGYLSLLRPEEWEDEKTIAADINYRLTDFYDYLEQEEDSSRGIGRHPGHAEEGGTACSHVPGAFRGRSCRSWKDDAGNPGKAGGRGGASCA